MFLSKGYPWGMQAQQYKLSGGVSPDSRGNLSGTGSVIQQGTMIVHSEVFLQVSLCLHSHVFFQGDLDDLYTFLDFD